VIYQGKETPTEYDLNNIKDMPIALLCGKEDLIVTRPDYFDLHN